MRKLNMGIERQEGARPELKIGEMPNPHYVHGISIDSEWGPIKWIEIKAYAPNGHIKKFYWLGNFQVGDLSNESIRRHISAYIVRIKLEIDTDLAIGPAIDFSKSNPSTGLVQIPHESGEYGVYVEAEKRSAFNIMVEMYERRKRADVVNETIRKAEAVMPRPNLSKSK